MTSLLLWLMLTWSFGCTSAPSASVATCAITSLAFMLELVPEPVWKTSIGKCSSYLPSATASEAFWIAMAISLLIRPSSALAPAAAHLTRPSAAMNWRGMASPDIGKLLTARCVCAPHSASSGTSSSPMLSFSMRNALSFMAGPAPGAVLTPLICSEKVYDSRFARASLHGFPEHESLHPESPVSGRRPLRRQGQRPPRDLSANTA